MKKRKLLKTFIFSLGVLPLTGCLTLNNDNDYANQLKVRRLQSSDKQQTQLLRQYTQTIGEQESLIRALADAMAQNDARIGNLEREMVSMKRSMGSNTKALEGRLAEERRLREKSSKALLGEIANTATTLQDRQKRALNAINAANAAHSSDIYEVQSGDTLGVIAKAFGITITSIKRANRLNSDLIRVGQKLTIPGK